MIKISDHPVPLRCVVVDDEPAAIRVISTYINRHGGLHVLGVFTHALEAKAFITANHPDLIICDIRMPGRSGIQLVEGLDYKPYVIFASAFDRYAINGFDLGVVDFLRKPFSYERFCAAIQKIVMNHNQVPSIEPQRDSFIFLKSGRSFHRLMLRNVLFFQAFGNYCKAFLSDGKSKVFNTKISSIDELVADYGMISVHKSYIVACAQVESFTNQYAIIRTTEVPIGESYRKNAVERLRRHMMKNGD